ncbi:MAG TPA: hypothetical protein VKU19_26490 [Bryobacteraceae bacterium]|nr:hypothetical protein [Bryobacteraceae bacterium]
MKSHLSSEEISRWVIGERSMEAEHHVTQCALCRSELDRLRETFLLFRESGIRWSDRCYAARFGAESAIYSSGPTRKTARLSRPWSCAVAASVLVCAVLLLRPAPEAPAVRMPDRRAEAPFLEIPYVAPLAPYERAAITRMDVPVAALIAAGFEVHVADVASTVKADILFGQDGRAHAVRLVTESIPNPDRRFNP